MDDWYLNYERFGKNEDLYRTYDERHSEGAEATKVIMKGIYRGRHFVIGAARSGFPVAYVEVLDSDSYIMDVKESWRAESLGKVNGSSNYYGDAYWDPNDKRKYIGWDYGHYDDYEGHMPNDWPKGLNEWNEGKHKWTLPEIMMEIAVACTELEYENYMHEYIYKATQELD